MRPLAADPAFPSDPVVTRWVHQGPRPVDEVLFDVRTLPLGRRIALEAGGGLRLDRPFARSTEASRTGATWTAQARVLTSGAAVVRSARVEISVVAWTDELTEVTLRRRGRHFVTWGERREHRYFALAHDAATYVAGVLAATITANRELQVA